MKPIMNQLTVKDSSPGTAKKNYYTVIMEQITKLFSTHQMLHPITCQQYLKKQNAQGGLRPGLDQSERHRDDEATKKRIPNNRFSGAQCNEEMKCKGKRVVTVFKNFVGETLVDHIAAYT